MSRLPSRIDAQKRHVATFPFKLLADFQHGRMLDGGRDDVAAVRIGLDRAENGRVVALRAQLVNRICMRIGQPEDAGRSPRGPAAIAWAAGLAASYIELGLKYSVRQKRHHRLDDFRGDPRGGVVVGVNNVHGWLSRLGDI